MRAARVIPVVALGVSAAFGHVVYPALLGLAARTRVEPRPTDPTQWPPVSVVVCAYREAGEIGGRVRDILDHPYPAPVEAIVVADDRATADAARVAGARVIENAVRRGKSAALDQGVQAAQSEVVVLTDANSRLGAQALCKLARHFCDADVAAVTGMAFEADKGGEEIYSRFEAWMKQRESALGTTIGASGQLLAIRRSAWRPVPADTVVDDLWMALDLAERGLSMRYDREAVSLDNPVPLQEQWERRTRISSGILFAVWDKKALLARLDLVSAQILGHKLWRASGGPLSHIVLLALAVREFRRSRVAQAFVLGHVLGLGTVPLRGRRLPRALALPAEVLFLQLVALGGLLRVLRGDRAALWPKPER